MSDDRYCCHGLGVVQPINALAAELDARDGKHSFIVGGFNPPLEQAAIEKLVRSTAIRGRGIVWIGHSMGAALGFYLAQKFPLYHFKLIVTVDPMCWASNIECANWATEPPHPGHWIATGKFDRWINIRSSQYPGGGVLDSAYAHRGAARDTEADPRCADHHFPDCDHIGIISDPRVRAIIFDAVKGV
jgi:pimeloyl-ACP methyl ester carboxylesterase